MSDQSQQHPKAATEATRAVHREAAALGFLDDPGDHERATRGRVAQPSSPTVAHEGGWDVWDLASYRFLADDAPPEVHPSLWRQARLNAEAGLFEIAPGFHQVRGLDLANLTVIEGHEGRIVIDPLTSVETARAALALVDEHLGPRPVTAVIYTHSHADHFAGVRGVIDEADVAAGRVRVIAPSGFLEAAVSENVMAGNAMTRRATYMYGPLLPKGPRGHVDAGLGKGVPLLATQGLIAPTEEVEDTGTELAVDGVRIVFQVTPDTEAPSEMNFHFPDHRVLCMAENCTCTLHNLYTPRGAQVRNALAWSKYLQEAIDLFGDLTDVCFASHHWPRWGTDDLIGHLARQRDTYRFLHDQTLRLANHGLTSTEIAEELRLPPELEAEPSSRGYYGTVSHNAKAVYQRYLGWFDGNPAHLHPHLPVAAAERYVDAMGGAEEVLAKGRVSFDAGDYRWVAEVVNHVVFAEPENAEARHLQADALEQLGYQGRVGAVARLLPDRGSRAAARSPAEPARLGSECRHRVCDDHRARPRLPGDSHRRSPGRRTDLGPRRGGDRSGRALAPRRGAGRAARRPGRRRRCVRRRRERGRRTESRGGGTHAGVAALVFGPGAGGGGG